MTIVWISWMIWNFVRFHEIHFQTDAESFSFLSWKTKKFYSLKKWFFKPFSISKHKSFVYQPNFQWRFWHGCSKFKVILIQNPAISGVSFYAFTVFSSCSAYELYAAIIRKAVFEISEFVGKAFTNLNIVARIFLILEKKKQ